MAAIEKFLLPIVKTVNAYLSDYVLIILLIGAGLFFTIKTRFVQVRCFGEGCKRVFGNLSLKGGKEKSGMSSFQAFATAVAAQVGTGNVVGASGAILIGGPGAIFWMWIIAFLGMATIYAEATLAVETRVTDDDGTIHGGPVYYIKKAFKGGFGKVLAFFFSVAAILALGFMGSMVQSNSIAEAVCNAAGVSYLDWGFIVGIVLAVVAGFIFLGGVQRIASFAEKIVPVMAVFFLVIGFVILGIRIKYVPETFALIFKYAFTPDALIGGGIGYALKTAISQGAKRGLFSNEAGMGSTPHAHAQANVEKPHDQGVAAMIGVFIDTFVVLTMTALVVICSLYAGDGILAGKTGNEYQLATAGASAIVSKTTAMQMAFATNLSKLFGASAGTTIGNVFVAICLTFFAFTTIVGWNFFGKVNVQYLFNNNKVAVAIYSVVSLAFIFAGTLLSNDLVWELTDFFNYLMVLPNVLAILVLYKFVVNNAKSNKIKN